MVADNGIDQNNSITFVFVSRQSFNMIKLLPKVEVGRTMFKESCNVTNRLNCIAITATQ